MGGIKVAAEELVARQFHANNGITNRWLVDASGFPLSVFVFKDCSWVIMQFPYHRRLSNCGRLWDVSRRPKLKDKIFQMSCLLLIELYFT